MRHTAFIRTAIITGMAIVTISTFAIAQKPTPTPVREAYDEPANVAFDGKISVPMEIYSRKPTVEVKINGKGPFRLFLDTGAGVTVLDQALATELKLEKDGTSKVGDPADPEGITADRNKIGRLEIGGAIFSDFLALSWDRSTLYTPGSPRGVLGMPLFRRLLLTIDYPGNKVEIARGALKKGGEVTELHNGLGGTFTVPIKVGDEQFDASLDSGSAGGLTFPNSFMKTLALDGEPKEVGRGRTVGGESIIYGGKLKGSVTFAGHDFGQMNVAFFDRLQHANVGFAILNRFAITLDQQSMLIRFAKGEPAAAVAAAPVNGSQTSEFAGQFGERRITVENGVIYLQRLSGPQGAGPKIKLAEVSKDTYSIEGIPGPRVKFARDAAGKVIELHVLNPAGEWETSKRNN